MSTQLRMTRNASRARRTAFRAACLGVALAFALAPTPLVAQQPSAFAMTARADALTLEYYDREAPAIPPRPVFFASPATAQADLDSLGTSRALAAAPDPGPFLRELPDETSGTTSGQVEPPPYPFAVRSSFPTDPANSAEGPGYHLDTKSDARQSTASAITGLATDDLSIGSARAHSTASVGEDGDVVAEATTRVEDIRVRDLVEIAHVFSHAKVSKAPGAAPQHAADTSLGAVTVAGVPVAVTEDGTVVPDPASSAVADGSELSQQLRAAGIGLRYLPARLTSGSAGSAALEITLSLDEGRHVAVTLGRVSAAAATKAHSPAGAPGGGVAPSAMPPVSTLERPFAPAPSDLGGTPAGQALGVPQWSDASPAVTTIPATANPLASTAAAPFGHLYLALVGVAAAGLLGLRRQQGAGMLATLRPGGSASMH